MSFLANTRLQSILLVVFALLLNANTLGHGFVLDDPVVITQNRWVQAGFKGIPDILTTNSFAGYLTEGTDNNMLPGGRYRPLSMVCFAVLTQLVGNNALVFHLFALLLYALTALLLYRVLLLALQPAADQPATPLIAWATTLLFVAHPVHTEVVANIKSCDEQLALLAGLGALYCSFRAFDTRRWTWTAGAAGLFLLACLAKENALSWLLLCPLALWFFRSVPVDRATPRPAFFPAALRAFLPLLLAAGVYIVLRGTALHWQFGATATLEPLNNPFLKSDGQKWVAFTGTEKSATILYTLLQYARLLVFPYPLTHDYYPFQIEPQRLTNPTVLGGIALYLLLAGLALWGLIKRSRPAFGIFLYLLPLLVVANIFFPVGTFMAERFLFTPSLGFCFAGVTLLVALAERFQKPLSWVAVGTGVIGLVFGAMTVLRNPVWANDKSLFEADLATSPKSAKLRNSLGTILLTEATQIKDLDERKEALKRAETHLKKAIELHPLYYDAILAYGACTFYLEKYDLSVGAYRAASRINTEDSKPKTGLAFALRYGGDFYGQGRDANRSIDMLTEAWQLNPDTATATHLARQYEALGKPVDAAAWLEKAVALAPDEARLLTALSKAYTAAGEPAKAAEVAKRVQLFTTFSSGGGQQGQQK